MRLARVFTAVEHTTLRDHAYASLREALMTGQFAPGEKLTIRGLAAAFGISPTPIREAVGRLAAERALQAEPNRFLRVPLLSVAELQELRDIRLALEGLAVERAAGLITKAELDEVMRLDAAIVALRPGGQARAMIPCISQLHFAIYRAARMPALLRLIEGCWLRTAPHVHLLFPGYTRQEKGVLRAALIAALRRGDAEAARKNLEEDVGRALDHIIGLVASAQQTA